MSRKRSIYEDIQEVADERFLLDELSEEEADIELERLEAAHAHFLNGLYRTWSRQKRYAHDRRSCLFQCLQHRRALAEAAVEGFEALDDRERYEIIMTWQKALKAVQITLVKLRAEYYAAQAVGRS